MDVNIEKLFVERGVTFYVICNLYQFFQSSYSSQLCHCIYERNQAFSKD